MSLRRIKKIKEEAKKLTLALAAKCKALEEQLAAAKDEVAAKEEVASLAAERANAAASDKEGGKVKEVEGRVKELERRLKEAQEEDTKDLLVELCLTVPARLNFLLPHIPLLMKPLVQALNGSNEMVHLGLKKLETWVEHLQVRVSHFFFSFLRSRARACTHTHRHTHTFSLVC